MMRLDPAPSPSGSINPKRIKGKPAFSSLENICLSDLTKVLPLFIQEKPRRPGARPAESHAWSGNPLRFYQPQSLGKQTCLKTAYE
ncbi:hypothetical protein FZC80_20220 [Rossellomorea aquimaris]|uniref:Uncharacterized protein n=1 Tax=Rossellomorea aquimaris TaxID=189382 RepID=A0A5D4TDR0_9BACI|nr:hypothetical protein FZC80_20220 [Rossellomorea aquimaris]